jgi:DNA-binding protein HU-beta
MSKKVLPINRKTFQKEISTLSGCTLEECDYVLRAIETVVQKELADRGIVRIPGVVEIRKKVQAATAERQGVNPWNGKPCTFRARPAKNVLRFKAHKDLALFMAAHPIEANDAVQQVSDNASGNEGVSGAG